MARAPKSATGGNKRGAQEPRHDAEAVTPSTAAVQRLEEHVRDLVELLRDDLLGDDIDDRLREIYVRAANELFAIAQSVRHIKPDREYKLLDFETLVACVLYEAIETVIADARREYEGPEYWSIRGRRTKKATIETERLGDLSKDVLSEFAFTFPDYASQLHADHLREAIEAIRRDEDKPRETSAAETFPPKWEAFLNLLQTDLKLCTRHKSPKNIHQVITRYMAARASAHGVERKRHRHLSASRTD